MKRIAALLLCSAILNSGCGESKSKYEPYQATVIKAIGRHIVLSTNKIVALVGIYIPYPIETNYQEEFLPHLVELIEGKEITVQTIEKKHKSGYPFYDNVEIYLDGQNVNRHLLETGMAFFYEDHWNKKKKNEYRKLYAQAQNERVGIWENIEELEVMFYRPKKGRFVHIKECRYVKDLKPDERVEYYAPISRSPFMAIRHAYYCDFCRLHFSKIYKNEDNKKVKLES